jgi:hypothetical protein
MLTPSFHFKILEDFLEVFSANSEILVKKLQQEVDRDYFDVHPYITNCALDIICGQLWSAVPEKTVTTIEFRQDGGRVGVRCAVGNAGSKCPQHFHLHLELPTAVFGYIYPRL